MSVFSDIGSALGITKDNAGATVGALGGLGSIAGGALSAGASSSAAKAQEAAAQAALAQQQEQYEQTRSDLAPYRQAGAAELPTATATANDNPYYAQAAGLYGGVNQTIGGAGNYINAANDDLGKSAGYYEQGAGLLGSGASSVSASQGNIYGANQDNAAQVQGLNASDATVDKLSGGLTQAYLSQTPGYQFALSQGLESTQNSAAARGLGSSGAAEKAAASYATGLADQTYQNQFGDTLATAQQQTANANSYGTAGANQIIAGSAQMAQGTALGSLGTQLAGVGGNYTNNSVAANSLAGTVLNAAGEQTNLGQSYASLGSNLFGNQQSIAGLGETAAAQGGQIGQQAAENQSSLLTGAGNAQAAGTIGSANALSGSLTNAPNSYLQYQLYNNLLKGGKTS